MIGMPRSGTTVTFQAFSAHEEVAWFSQLFDALPWLPAVSVVSRVSDLAPGLRKANRRTDQRRRVLERGRVGPSEAYRVWERLCGEKFLHDFMLGLEATQRERKEVTRVVDKVMRYHGKPRFVAKLTGPARIRYLSSIFPDALFIHVVRDGRAVVRSLLNVGFWKDTWRVSQPAWRNGLHEDQLERWRASGRSPAVLAALQWVAVLEHAREEAASIAPGRYAELRYEDFIADPETAIAEALRFSALPPSAQIEEYLRKRVTLRNMNSGWSDRFEGAERNDLEDVMGEWLARLGYCEDGRVSSVPEPLREPVAGHQGGPLRP